MIARLVQVIEVSSGGVRRYFTTTGESIGLGPEGAGLTMEPGGAPRPDEVPFTAAQIIASVPRKRFVPPWNPGEVEAAKPGEVPLEVEV